jgi:hypothetical protein
MPPSGAPSVTQPVAMPFRASNHWLTTLNAIVVGAARKNPLLVSRPAEPGKEAKRKEKEKKRKKEEESR